MRKTILIIVIIAFITFSGNAQVSKYKTFEFTFGTGITQFYGDIGGYSNGKNMLGFRDATYRNVGYNININSRYRIAPKVSVRLSLVMGSFHSADSKGSNESRGYESSAIFFEPAIIGEYYFIKNDPNKNFLTSGLNRSGFRSFVSLFDLYAFAGFGGLQYNVTPSDILGPHVNNTSGFTAVIPGGVGMNIAYSASLSFGLEYGVGYSFSDNLDGYSTSYSKANDVYHFLNLTFTYKF